MLDGRRPAYRRAEILATAQLLLAAVHIAKGSAITFGLLLPLLVFTYLTHTQATAKWAPQLETLPLAERAPSESQAAAAHTSPANPQTSAAAALQAAKLKQLLKLERGSLVKPQRSPVAVSDLQIRVVARLMRRPTAAVLTNLFGDAFTQPELLHPEVTDPPPGPFKRTRLVSYLKNVPGVRLLCPCVLGLTEAPQEVVEPPEDGPDEDDASSRTSPAERRRSSQRRSRDEMRASLIQVAPHDRRPSALAVFLHDSAHVLSIEDAMLDAPAPPTGEHTSSTHELPSSGLRPDSVSSVVEISMSEPSETLPGMEEEEPSHPDGESAGKLV